MPSEPSRRRSFSPVDLLQAVIDRIEETNESVNCLTYTYFDRALAQAREAERIYSSAPDSARPLEGVPCAIKDWHSVAGARSMYAAGAGSVPE